MLGMKRTLVSVHIFLLVVLFHVQGESFAQDTHSPERVLALVEEAIGAGDSRMLLEVSTTQIEIDLGEGTSLYSRDQARYVLSAFFEHHPPSELSLEDVTVLPSQCTVQGSFSSLDSDQPRYVFLRLARLSSGWRLKEIRMIPTLPPSDQLPAPYMLQQRRK